MSLRPLNSNGLDQSVQALPRGAKNRQRTALGNNQPGSAANLLDADYEDKGAVSTLQASRSNQTLQTLSQFQHFKNSKMSAAQPSMNMAISNPRAENLFRNKKKSAAPIGADRKTQAINFSGMTPAGTTDNTLFNIQNVSQNNTNDNARYNNNQQINTQR